MFFLHPTHPLLTLAVYDEVMISVTKGGETE